jgi:hypothetical protein
MECLEGCLFIRNDCALHMIPRGHPIGYFIETKAGYTIEAELFWQIKRDRQVFSEFIDPLTFYGMQLAVGLRKSCFQRPYVIVGRNHKYDLRSMKKMGHSIDKARTIFDNMGCHIKLIPPLPFSPLEFLSSENETGDIGIN